MWGTGRASLWKKKEGKLRNHKEVIITDLPGIYSLSPYTLEEVVSRNYLIHDKPDVILNLVDGTNLERNLYLTTQIAELGIPMVIALNMMDLVKKNGDKIDTGKLSAAMGCEIVETSALKGEGSMEAAEKAIALAKEKKAMVPQHTFTPSVENALDAIADLIGDDVEHQHLRWYAIKLFERDEKVMETFQFSSDVKERLEDIISEVEQELDDDSESIITNERYEYISKLMKNCFHKKSRTMTTSDKIDRVVTNRILALPIFVAIMFLVYYVSVSTAGTIFTDWANDGVFGDGWHLFSIGASDYAAAVENYEELAAAAEETGTDLTVQEPDPAQYGIWVPGIPVLVGNALESAGTADWLDSLILDGIIGGVGAVLGFVPQMLILFFFLSILEDCGYMARIAFIMDRIFRRFGLSGKSFIPMLISSGCGVPGVMATKTIENEKDRRMTIITTTFIPCSAKLPIIALIVGAMMGQEQAGWIAPLMYFLGVAAVIVSGIILKKTKMFAGDPAPFVMELPQYHIPSAKGVLIHMWERSRAFITKAGTVIFVACGIVWFLSNFGWADGGSVFGLLDMEDTTVNQMDYSILAYRGNFIAPVFAPLGFGNWQATVATFTGLVAKENVVSTFGILFGLGEAGENDPSMWTAVSGMLPLVTTQIAFLAFNMLCAPCFAAIGAIRREMSSAKWTWFAIGYQTIFAYCIALMIHQLGGFLSGALVFGPGTAVALVILAVFLFLLFRPASLRKSTLNHARAAA